MLLKKTVELINKNATTPNKTDPQSTEPRVRARRIFSLSTANLTAFLKLIILDFAIRQLNHAVGVGQNFLVVRHYNHRCAEFFVDNFE